LQEGTHRAFPFGQSQGTGPLQAFEFQVRHAKRAATLLAASLTVEPRDLGIKCLQLGHGLLIGHSGFLASTRACIAVESSSCIQSGFPPSATHAASNSSIMPSAAARAN